MEVDSVEKQARNGNVEEKKREEGEKVRRRLSRITGRSGNSDGK